MGLGIESDMHGGGGYLGGKSLLNQGLRDKKGTDCAEI